MNTKDKQRLATILSHVPTEDEFLDALLEIDPPFMVRIAQRIYDCGVAEIKEHDGIPTSDVRSFLM